MKEEECTLANVQVRTVRKKNSLVKGSTKKILGDFNVEPLDYHIILGDSCIVITDYLRDGIVWIKSRGKLYLPYTQRDKFWGDMFKMYYTKNSNVWELREETLRYGIKPKWNGDIYKYNKKTFMQLVDRWLKNERAIPIPLLRNRLLLPLPETVKHLESMVELPRGKKFITEDEHWRSTLVLPRRQFKTARQTAIATYGLKAVIDGLPDNPEVKKDYDNRYR